MPWNKCEIARAVALLKSYTAMGSSSVWDGLEAIANTIRSTYQRAPQALRRDAPTLRATPQHPPDATPCADLPQGECLSLCVP